MSTGGWFNDIDQAAGQGEFEGGHASRPYVGVVKSVNPDDETITVEAITGKKAYNYPHAFSSGSSWIRSAPDADSGVIMQRAADLKDPMIIRFYNPANVAATYKSALGSLREDPTKKEITGITNRRIIQSGEHHLSSVGLSEIFMSARGALEMRGGAIQRSAIHDDLEAVDRAPLHRRTLHRYRYGEIGNEERMGVVKRWDPDQGFSRETYVRVAHPMGFALQPPASLDPSKLAEFLLSNPPVPKAAAMEWLVNIGWNGLPDTLYDHRVGHVYEDDDTDEQAKLDWTSTPLRARYRWFTTPLGNPLEVGIDELGNFEVTLPTEALKGGHIKIPTGGLEVETTLDMKLTILKGLIFAVTGLWSASADLGINLSSKLKTLVEGVVEARLKSTTMNVLDAPLNKIGGEGAAKPVATLADLQALAAAIAGAVIVPMDGGAALKAAMTAWVPTGSPTVMVP